MLNNLLNKKKDMKYLSNIIALCMILVLNSSAFAQPDQRMENRKDQIKAMKVAYITQLLNLSPEESQTFWPLYNQMEEEKKQIKKSGTDKASLKENLGNMSDKDLEAVIEKEFAMKQQLLDLQRQYYQKFKAVLPMQKIIKLQYADNAFNREILKKMRDKRKEMNSPRR